MRMPKHHLLASVLFAAAALIATFAIGASAAAPLKITNCNRAASQPKLLTLTCGDGNTVVKGLSWSAFGGTTAQAKGTFVTNTCEPNCAAGPWIVRTTIRGVRTRARHLGNRAETSHAAWFEAAAIEHLINPASPELR